MASTSRPLSLSQPSASRIESSFSADHLTPLRRSISPTGQGHYTLKRFSYIADLPTDHPLFVPRPRSILRSSSFTMGFGFRSDKVKGKEKEKEKDHVSTPSPGPSSSTAIPPPPPLQRPSTSHSLFSRNKSKSMKKKRSLSSLLEAADGQGVAGPSAIPASRSRSSDAALALSAGPSNTSKGKRLTLEEQLLEERMNEYRQIALNHSRVLPPKPVRKKQKTVWARRHNMKVHTDSGTRYMQAYDPILLENDRQSHLLLRQLNSLENPVFRDHTGKEPIQVLDMGCGAGHWMMDAVNYWKRVRVTGVDIVDILVPEAKDHDQIDFILGNFLDFPWPFQNGQFDIVRMANLTLCIPYDQWETIIAEAHRILHTGGRLEFIDDELVFPYAPPPASKLASITGSIIKPASTLNRTSYFTDSDDDTGSINTDSTLVSNADGDASSPSRRQSRRQSSTSTSISTSDSQNGDDHQPQEPLSPGAELPTTPNSAVTIKPTIETVTSSLPSSDWNSEAAACRDMETVYRNMLHKRFGVHSQPAQFVPDVMQHVFGNAGEVKSFHLRLAPKDAEKEFSKSATDLVVDEKEKPTVESKKTSRGKSWFSSDPDKEEKKRKKKMNKPPIPFVSNGATISTPGPDSPVPEGVNAKAADRLGITPDLQTTVSRIPENISAKAAIRLGITTFNERPIDITSRLSTLISNDESPSDFDSTPSPSPSPSPVPSDPSDSEAESPAPLAPEPSSTQLEGSDNILSSPTNSRLSAKAAHRLGISYSALSEATASAKRRPVSSSSTLVFGSTPVQSPGLIVWPNQFIPMSPAELEMHALKNVHTLIGCKPALAEYVGSFLDESGNKIKSLEDFNEDLWMYECFRRRRFNWPETIPSDWEIDPETDAPDSATTTPSPTSKPGSAETAIKSTTLRNSMDTPVSLSTLHRGDSTPGPPYKPDELTQVRTIRVFEAVKMGEYTLSTMQTPRSPPPSPPR